MKKNNWFKTMRATIVVFITLSITTLIFFKPIALEVTLGATLLAAVAELLEYKRSKK